MAVAGLPPTPSPPASYSYLLAVDIIPLSHPTSLPKCSTSLLPIPPPRSTMSVLRLQATRSDACHCSTGIHCRNLNRDRAALTSPFIFFILVCRYHRERGGKRERERDSNLLCKNCTAKRVARSGPIARVCEKRANASKSFPVSSGPPQQENIKNCRSHLVLVCSAMGTPPTTNQPTNQPTTDDSRGQRAQ